jgi:tetratricopeptide (TPR) repeat protein
MWFGVCCVIVIAGYTSVFSQTVSDEARRHFDRGTAAVEMARSPADYDVAIKEFKQAIDLAPDWADAYYNLAKVQEQAEKFADAIASFQQYLRLAPNASDAEAVKSLINKLQFKAENTLTTADIISVLTSLSKWKDTGQCVVASFRQITSKDEGLINVPSACRPYGPCSPASYQALKVEGPTVKYRWTYNQCGTEGVGSCRTTFAEEIEVISKTRVKVRQVVLSSEAVQSGREWVQLWEPGHRYECELSPPK